MPSHAAHAVRMTCWVQGFAAQGNEFSYYMLITSSFMLNCSTEAEQASRAWATSPGGTHIIMAAGPIERDGHLRCGLLGC